MTDDVSTFWRNCTSSLVNQGAAMSRKSLDGPDVFRSIEDCLAFIMLS
jgi:hypothetical protein